MERRYFNLILVMSIGLGAVSAVLMHQGSSSMKLAAALTGLSGYLFLGYAKDKAVGLSRMNQVKMDLNVSSELFELLIIGSFLATTLVPQRLGITVLATLVFLKVVLEEANRNLNVDLSTKLGDSYRVYTVLGVAALSILNSYYFYYGAYVLLGVILYDLGLVFYRFYEDKQGIKLKNRILSN